MPVCLNPSSELEQRSGSSQFAAPDSISDFRESDANCLEVGLVNNMPCMALQATERQFRARLSAAAGGILVRLTFYALPEVPRTEEGRRHVQAHYSDIRDLWDGRLDGLIVTGAEPRAPELNREPYWGSLAMLLEWAERHTYSSIWSCLAAHAAVLHADGIVRRPLEEKRFGVFECERVSGNALAAAVPACLRMPHSRWNELPEQALHACGYHFLTRSRQAGADSFVKQRKSLLLFFQGHPEYEADTLLLEYRRDVGRFLRRERDGYPALPRGYFDEEATCILTAFQEQAMSNRGQELLARFPVSLLAARVRDVWSPAAVPIYRSWLLHLRQRKERYLKARGRRTRHVAAIQAHVA
jgi:homoserine O-succinyltransferase